MDDPKVLEVLALGHFPYACEALVLRLGLLVTAHIAHAVATAVPDARAGSAAAAGGRAEPLQSIWVLGASLIAK